LTSTIESFSSATGGRCSGGATDGGDAVPLVEVEHVVEEANEDVLVLIGAEDPLEGEAGLGVREDGALHGCFGRLAIVSPRR